MVRNAKIPLLWVDKINFADNNKPTMWKFIKADLRVFFCIFHVLTGEYKNTKKTVIIEV